MTLEDFFTLSEMKDGLGTIARVEELISVMQEQKIYVLTNVGDAIRQWSALAGILAATENKDCLQRFIQLNGLWFFNHWLQEAQKHSFDGGDGSVGKLVYTLLGALQRLPINREISVSSGIGLAGKQICDNNNHFILEKGKILLGKWNLLRSDDIQDHDLQNCGLHSVDEQKVITRTIEEGVQPAHALNNSTEEVTRKGDHSIKFAENDSGNLNTKIYQVIITSANDEEMEVTMDIKEPSYCKSSQKEDCIVSSSSSASSSPLQAQNSITVSATVSNLNSKNSESLMIKTSEPQLKSSVVEFGLPKYLRTKKESKTVARHSSSGKSETPVQTLGAQNASDVEEIRRSSIKISKGVNSRTRCVSLKPATHTTNELDYSCSEIGLEYGDDALEFAVQVAMEAKHEVADREQYSSSQGGHAEGEIMDSGSLVLEENAVVESISCVSPPKLDHSDGDSLPSEKSSRTSENIDSDQSESFHKAEKPKSDSAAQESLVRVVRCNFDLNEGLSSEDFDRSSVPAPHQQNLSVPIAVVATSKGSHMLPRSPPQFEGESGWRGSAATSAFRPASSRKNPPSKNMVPNNMVKTKSLEIDLNRAKGDGDDAVDPELEKHVPSSGLCFGNCSVEVSSKRAGRPNLDLNQLGDDDAFPSSSCWRLRHQNGNRSSPPASSSSAKQPSLRNFDLNDIPPIFDACSPQNKTMPCSKNSGTYGIAGSDVLILGSRMSATRREHTNQGYQPFSGNSLHMESMTVTGSSVVYPYMPFHGYGYNGVSAGPATLSSHPDFCGPGSFSYMADSRGITSTPQVLGSSTGLVGQPNTRPFLVSAAGNSLGLGTAGSSRPTLDLNSGSLSLDSGRREFRNFRKLFVQGHNGLTEEHKMAASHSIPGSAASLKRTEPDSGWEPHPIDYEQMAHWC